MRFTQGIFPLICQHHPAQLAPHVPAVLEVLKYPPKASTVDRYSSQRAQQLVGCLLAAAQAAPDEVFPYLGEVAGLVTAEMYPSLHSVLVDTMVACARRAGAGSEVAGEEVFEEVLEEVVSRLLSLVLRSRGSTLVAQIVTRAEPLLQNMSRAGTSKLSPYLGQV